MRNREGQSVDARVLLDGDAGCVGVEMRAEPGQLRQGYVAEATNAVFTDGVVETRPGFRTVGWAAQNAVEFPIEFKQADGSYGETGLPNKTTAEKNVVFPNTFRYSGGSDIPAGDVTSGDYVYVQGCADDAYNGVFEVSNTVLNLLWVKVDEATLAAAGASTSGTITIKVIAHVDWNIKQGFGEALGALTFSDPNGNEAILVATPHKVYRIGEGIALEAIDLPDGVTLSGRVTMTQCFNKVILFRGETEEPLEWDPQQTFSGGLNAFTAITQTSSRINYLDNTLEGSDSGTVPIPNAERGALSQNRLWIPFNRDRIAVSDILDYTRYSTWLQELRANFGSDDAITRLEPWRDYQMLIFKEQSILLLSNTYGDLSALRLDLVTREYGCIAPDSVAALADDVLFLSEQGVMGVRKALDGRMSDPGEPLSKPIDPLIRRINWSYARNSVAAYADNRYYLAVPLDGSQVNNTILVYDVLTGAWAGSWTADWLAVRQFVRADYLSKRQLLVLNGAESSNTQARGALFVVRGFEDVVFDEHEGIALNVLTRGYHGSAPGRKRFQKLRLRLATWAPQYSVEVERDGYAETTTLLTDVTRSRTRYHTLRDDWDASNVNGDFETPYREDYSVEIPEGGMYFDTNVELDRHQQEQTTLHVGGRGAWCAVRLSNNAGRVRLLSSEVSAAEHDNSIQTEV